MSSTESLIEDFRTVRECPRCRYTIYPGFYHKEQPQPEGASHVVCSLERTAAILRGPVVQVINAYLNEVAGAERTVGDNQSD